MSDKPINKPVEKAIVVLHRMEPLAGRFEDAKKVSEEWFEFLKKIPDCKKIFFRMPESWPIENFHR